ncbi:hypothetical protein MKW92_037939, partial [Papaver armeniacum]
FLYLWLVISDLILRFTWTYKYIFSPPHHSFTVMVFAIGELVRRSQWAYFRTEKEDIEIDKATSTGPGTP